MKKHEGMTLMEVLAALLVLTLLVVAVGTSLDLLGRTEGTTRFASESDALAAVLQTTLEDVLGFGENVAGGSFSNRSYGIVSGTLCVVEGKLCVREAEEARPLLGSGVYGDLSVADLQIQFIPPGQSGTVTRPDGSVVSDIPGGVFYVTFRIENAAGLSRDYETAARLVNPE